MAKWSELGWTELGAVVGGLVGLVPAAALATIAVMQGGGFMSSEEPPGGEDLFLFGISSIAAAIVVAASAFSCAWTLSKRGLHRARETAILLSMILAVIYLSAAYSTTTSFQSDLYPWAIAATFLAPVVARALVNLRHTESPRST